MKTLLIIAFISFSFSGTCQAYYDSTKLSPLVKSIAEKIQHLTINDSAYLRNEKEFNKHIKILEERAKIFELLLLTEHPSAYVRLHAFNLLLTAAYPNFVDVLAKHIDDKDSLTFPFYGCVYISTTVAKQMADLVSSNNSWIGQFPWEKSDTERLSDIIDKIWGRR